MARINAPALLFLLVPLAVFPHTYDPYIIKELTASLFVMATLLFFLLKGKKIAAGGLSFQILLFAGVMSLSLIKSSNLAVSLLKLAGTLPFFLLYFLIDKPARGAAVECLAAAVLGVSGCGIFQKIYFLTAGVSGPFSGRIYSTCGNPNFLSSFLLSSFPLFYMRMEKSGKEYLAILPYACIILSGTAGSILSMTVILILLALFRKDSKLPKALAAVHILLIISAFIFTDVSAKKESLRERFFKWKVGFQMLRKNPVLGVGIGGVKTNFALFQPEVKREFPLQSTSESKIHNDYIQILAETGLAGFAAYLYLIISAAVLLRKNNFYAFAALLGYLLDSVTNFPLSLPSSLIVFILILSFGGERKIDKPLSKTKSAAQTSAAFAVSLFCLFITGKDFAADRIRYVGKYLYDGGNFNGAIHFLEKAHRISPTSGKVLYFLGMSHINLKNYPAAARAFGESVKIRNYGEIYNDLGNALYLNGETEKALSAWRKAVELGIPEKESILKNIKLLEKDKLDITGGE